MRQLAYVGPGTLEELDAPDPLLEREEQAIVRPVAVATCDLDSALVRGLTPWSGPMPLGHEGVAEVLEVGPGVRSVKRGDLVCLPYQVSCGRCDRCRRGLSANCEGHGGSEPGPQFFGFSPTSREWGGFFSDRVRIPFADHMLVPLPQHTDPAALASLSDNIVDGWRAVALPLAETPGESVLVVGGSGAIGLYAVGFAVALGAEQVTYVDRAPDRLAKAEALGATVIEANRGLPDRVPEHTVTVDANSTPDGVRLAMRSTSSGGTCTVTGMHFRPVEIDLYELWLRDVTVRIGLIQARRDMPRALTALQQSGFDPHTITDRVLPWEDARDALPEVRSKLVFTRPATAPAS